MSWPRFVALGSGAAAAIVLVVVLSRASGDDSPRTDAAPAPDFRAQRLDGSGRARTLRDYKGEVVLLNVWATWCPPCLQEMPSLQRLHETLAARGLRIVAISIDDAGSEALIADFVREQGLTFEVLHDPAGAVMESYGMRGVPETFLISRDGRILLRRYVADWMTQANRAAVEAAL
jgi:cytochrome c biogenesis protein CcmG/thiol:disulfide interchange protein DsbE